MSKTLRFAPSGGAVQQEPPPEGFVVTADANGDPVWKAGFSVTGTPAAGKFVGWDGFEPAWLYPGTPITISSFTHAPSTVLAGASVVSPAFTASYSSTPSSAVLTDTEGDTNDVTATPTAFTSPHTFTKTVYGQSVTFTLTATLAGNSDAKTTSITWGQLVYFGVAVDPGVYTQAFIKSLASSNLQISKAGSYAVNSGAGTNTFYASRSAYALTALSFQVNGLPFAITKVASAVALTNANGVTENYDLWMSDNKALGSFTFTVS